MSVSQAPLVIPTHLKKYVKAINRKSGEFTIKTYSVFPTNNNGKVLRHGPDDQTYINFPELVDLVPRGCSDLFLGDEFVCSLRGLKKFNGTSSIDEDDAPYEGSTDNHTSLFPEEKVKQWESNKVLEVEYQPKYNGKFVIFTLFEMHNKTYIFGGSKNVHIIRDLYDESKSDELHEKMLNRVCRDILNHHNESEKIAKKNSDLEEVRQMFDTFCNSRQTFCGEYIDYKHMVYSCFYNSETQTYTTYTPHIEYFNCPYLSINTNEKTNTMPTIDYLQSIRNQVNDEGVVIVYRNTETGETYRQKHKTKWYIILRCWRELISRLDKSTVEYKSLSERLINRLNERSDQFLHMTPKELELWESHAYKFSQWLYNSIYKYSDVGPFSEIGMGQIWYYYSNNIPVQQKVDDLKQEVNPLTNLEEHKYYNAVITCAKLGISVCVIMSGLPGSGKTTVAQYLLEELKLLNITAERFSTDDLFIENGEYKFNNKLLPAKHNENFERFNNSSAQIRIVDNTNLIRWEYDRYLKAANGCICIVLHMKKYDVNILTKRNQHDVPKESLEKMYNKYKIAGPAYFGVFPNKSVITSTFPNILITQHTPLHITVNFIGGDSKKVECSEFDKIGKSVRFEVLGISNNDAGSCLVTKFIDEQLSGNHITLCTNANFKPVDVGKSITDENTTKTNHIVLEGYYLPMW